MKDLPQPLSQPLAIPEPKDAPYCGVLRLEVDARDVLRRIFYVYEVIPVERPGVLTLMYPKWLPGYHSPQAPIELLTGLVFEAGGEKLHWVRHPTEVHAFHIQVPDAVSQIEVRFQYVSPTNSSQGRVVANQKMLNLEWNCVVLYPAGHFARQIEVETQLTLPEQWDLATALPIQRRQGRITLFDRVGLDELVDSPLMAGLHARHVQLDESVTLNIFAESPHQLEATPQQIEAHRGVVEQADLLFGPRPFDHYEVLLALSDEIGSIGVEHHRSCEIVSVPDYFSSWESTFPRHNSFPHEYIHGWNGKHRRGADSWTPSFDQPIRNSLMWVYEGQTQYWDRVLAARSGLWTPEHALAAFADTAATHEVQAGSRWRPLSDTTRDPIIAGRSPLPWPSWQRSEDYYTEGALIWLDVDTRIRELTEDSRSLDDFARAFFGADDQRGGHTQTYLFDDVVRTLGGIAEYSWADFFIDMLRTTRTDAPLGGIERGGYRLVYQPEPTKFWRARDQLTGMSNFLFSVGLTVSSNGNVGEVRWGSPAFEAAVTSGCTIIGANGEQFSPEALERAIAASSHGTPIELLVRSGKYQRTIILNYDGGHRYPHLERVEGTRARLDEIFRPRPVEGSRTANRPFENS